jgi:hypothetical protein
MKTIRTLVGIFLVTVATTGLAAARQQAAGEIPPASTVDDWPDAAKMEERRLEAEGLPLFQGTGPVEVTLTADFKAVQADRNPESTRMFPATVQLAGADGGLVTREIQIRTRGHSRRSYNVCDFAPLRLELPKGEWKGTAFQGLGGGLKLGVHCREGVKAFEQYVLREYAAYRIYNLITPQSFRARLARVTYVDAVKQEPISTRFGLFIEDDDEVAKRMGGRITEERGHLARLDRDTFTRMTLFEYLIGNVDVSVIAFHNIVAVQMPSGVVHAVPYDFDYSGLVDASYALPAPGLGITTVRDRVFRGPCRTDEELQAFFDTFRAIRSDIATMYDSLPEFFDAGAKKRAIGYLDGFYKTLEKPNDVKKAFLDRCLKRGLM